MKLCEQTIKILENFRDINNGIVIKPGNKLRTISVNKAVLAEAIVEESFPLEVGIYDLGKVLDILKIHSYQEIDFKESFISVGDPGSRGKTRVRYSDPKLILVPPNKEINIAAFDASLKLSEEDLLWIEKVGSILKCPYVVFECDRSKITISAADVKGEITDDSSLLIADVENTPAFKYVFKVENLKLLPGTYEIQLADRGLAKFSHTSLNVHYWVAIEKNTSNIETKESN